jgi:NAD(P)-dependent dehydrogenase (short-subunit alcohol dehydrogenase family)
MMTNGKRCTMNALQNKTALVTGGSRGIGRGIVETLAAQGVNVWAIARDAKRLETLKQDVKGVQTIAADITDPHLPAQTLHEIRPDILILNAGATPTMMPAHQMTWEQFNQVWETDVKSTFEFGKEALMMPMQPGSTVIILSSGAAIGGSPLSGSYASAKRAQWFLAQYFQGESKDLNRGIRFVALVPRQIVGMTDLGHAAATRYAAQQGLTKAEYLARMGAEPLTPEGIGQGVVSLLTDAAYGEGIAFGISGQGLAALN